jgi:hypothetical protein
MSECWKNYCTPRLVNRTQENEKKISVNKSTNISKCGNFEIFGKSFKI